MRSGLTRRSHGCARRGNGTAGRAAFADNAHLPARRLRDATGRERQLHCLPRRELVHRADLAGGRAHRTRRGRGWRSSTSPNISSSSPTTSGVRWLLEHRAHDARRTSGEGRSHGFISAIDRFFHSEFDIGQFRDKATRQGSVIASTRPAGRSWTISTATACSTSSSPRWTPPSAMAFYRNRGDGTFEDRSEAGRA